MAAARKQAFNGRSTASGSRNAAIAAVQINWKKMSPDGDRDERLEWISEYLGREVHSLTDLTDQQLGAVAGEMKRLTGQPTRQRTRANGVDNVVRGDFDRDSANSGRSSTVFLASHEQVHTLEKLRNHMGWNQNDVFEFIKKRVLRGKAKLAATVPNFPMLTFRQATTATNVLLHIAGHRDLKKLNGGKPVSRTELNKYIPHLKAELRIDQRRD